MAVKIQAGKAEYSTSVTSMIIMSMIYNCIVVIALCYLAIIKDWWAALLLIPFCTLTPSLKTQEGNTKSDKDEDDKEENNGE